MANKINNIFVPWFEQSNRLVAAVNVRLDKVNKFIPYVNIPPVSNVIFDTYTICVVYEI